MRAVFCALAVLASVQKCSAWFTSEVNFELNGSQYWAPAAHSLDITVSKELTGNGLVTCLPYDASNDTKAYWKAWSDALRTDDVWSSEFADTVIIYSNHSAKSIGFLTHLSELGAKTILVPSSWSGFNNVTAGSYSTSQQIFAGPGVILGDSIRPVRKIYLDHQIAFMSSAYPVDGAYKPVPVSAFTDVTGLPIAVPSRAESLASEAPLAGLRFGVKDLFDVAGLRTSAGSRNYQTTFPIANGTAPAIEKLFKLGAALIGKTKMSQFAFAASPTSDFVDIQAPFNARGDGYNSPSSSSSGSGAAAGSYGFLDFTIGSDTGGSVRSPADYNGVYGIRPSYGYLSLERVVPQNDLMDTAGLLTRDPALFTKVGRAWYSDTGMNEGPFKSLPKVLTSISDYQQTGEFQEQIDAFVAKVSAALNMTLDAVNVTDIWAKKSGYTTPVSTYMQSVFSDLTGWYSHEAVGKPFFAAYAEQNNGSTPFVDPPVAAGWAFAINRTEGNYTESISRKAEFKKFWLENALLPSEETCTQSIMVYPFGFGSGSPSPRDTYAAGPISLDFFAANFIAPYTGAAEITIPIGQLNRPSSHNGGTQEIPISLDFMAYPGCDYVLFDLVDRLVEAGLIQATQVGSVAF